MIKKVTKKKPRKKSKKKLNEEARERRKIREESAEGSHTLEEFEAKILARDRRCYYCNRKIIRKKICREHLTPLCRGGSNYIENIEPSCWKCNRQKGKKTEAEYREYLEKIKKGEKK